MPSFPLNPVADFVAVFVRGEKNGNEIVHGKGLIEAVLLPFCLFQ
jgi:hypothetical protein